MVCVIGCRWPSGSGSPGSVTSIAGRESAAAPARRACAAASRSVTAVLASLNSRASSASDKSDAYSAQSSSPLLLADVKAASSADACFEPPSARTRFSADFDAAALAWMIYGQVTGNPFLNVTLPSGLFGYTGTKEGEGLTLGLGTLVPSLTVSGLLLLICAWVARDEFERRSDS